MNFNIISPIQAIVENATPEEMASLGKQLSYINTAAQHQLKRHYNSHWFKNNKPNEWKAKLEEYKSNVNHCLLQGNAIRPGSIPYLTNLDFICNSSVKYPIPKKVAWAKPLPFELYDYQEEAWQKLLAVKHGNVELCTGSGKSAVILKTCRETGFKTAIIAPSQPIFEELLEKFEYHFGRVNVGCFGDGKKRLGKRFTVCIDDSVVNIKPGSEEWEFFSTMEMFCADESHTWGAKTLEGICHGVLSNVPYRLFFSGTQTRGDGAEKLLQSIIGPTVCTLTTEEAVKKGYICPHDYLIVEVNSSNPNFNSQDNIEMKRIHFLRNSNICNFICKLASAKARIDKQQSLVLVEELSQVAALKRLLEEEGISVAIAHSEKNAKKLALIGLPKVNKKESIESFNKAQSMVLVGTAAISTGTNIYPTHLTFNWQGGTSEIKTKQGAVGRSVRLGRANPWSDRCTPKDKATIVDFDVSDVYLMNRQLMENRIPFYQESGSEIKYIKIKR